MRTSLTLGLASLASPALGWGLFGHQITATIAQVYLLPSTRRAICGILPGTYKCNLAGVASWPDEIKMDPATYGDASTLHFVNAKDDHPPKSCVFPGLAWENDKNIIKGIKDKVQDVSDTQKSAIDRDHALRFLVHFLGDIHQPFHLTGQDRGANKVNVHWKPNDRGTNLHSIWDDTLIDYQMLFAGAGEYTSVLPTNTSATSPAEATRNKRIEAALTGLNYDPYIRYILIEGVYKEWIEEAKSWADCSQTNDKVLDAGAQSILDDTSSQFQASTVCPLNWAIEAHPMLCTWIWPDEAERNELSKGYAASVRQGMVVDKQLAKGGVRLAGVLNEIFGSAEDKAAYGLVPLFA